MVNIEDDALNFISLVAHLGGMADLAPPAHIAYVEKAVNALLDFDEGAIIGQIADHAADHGSRRITLGDFIPRIGLNLFHPQGNLLLIPVDIEDLDVDLVADGDDFTRMIDSLRPAHFADMDQPFDSCFQLDERPIPHHISNFATMTASDLVLFFYPLPVP